jgi:hypothetical protein
MKKTIFLTVTWSMTGKRGHIKPIALALLGILALMVISCKKDHQTDLNPSLNVADDIIISERPVIYAFKMLVKAATDTVLQQTHHKVIDRASVVYNPGQMRYTFYYFGLICSDGVIRTGRFDATLTGDLFMENSGAQIVFTDYMEDMMPVTGSDSLVCTGHVSGKVRFYNRAVLSIKKDSAGTILPYITLFYDTPLYNPFGFQAAEILITGADSGKSSKGYSYVSGVTDSLSLRMNCGWISRGTIGFTVTGAETNPAYILFVSEDGCSNLVDYNLGGTVYHWQMTMEYLRQ